MILYGLHHPNEPEYLGVYLKIKSLIFFRGQLNVEISGGPSHLGVPVISDHLEVPHVSKSVPSNTKTVKSKEGYVNRK